MPFAINQISMIQIKKFSIVAFFCFCAMILNAQKYEFGIGAGATHFKGDISPNFNPLQIGIGANALFRYNLSRSVSLRSQIMNGNYKTDDLNTKDPFYLSRGANANGSIFEAAVMADYNFLNLSNVRKQKEWTPYLFGGIGVARIANKSFINQPASKFLTPVIPYGIGVKYRFKGPWSVCGEFGTRFTFNDNLDKVYGTNFGNTNPPTSGNALNDKIAFSDTGRKDQYYFTNITLTYTIFNLVCDK
jgi:Domain of unknown function (DUF6089)